MRYGVIFLICKMIRITHVPFSEGKLVGTIGDFVSLYRTFLSIPCSFLIFALLS